MAKLTKAQRAALPASSFALPETRQYPIPDASHARFAKDEATAHVARGLISAETRAKINAAADQVLAREGKIAPEDPPRRGQRQ